MSTQLARPVSVQSPLPGSPPHDPVRVDSPPIERTSDEQINEIVERLQPRYTREQISVADLNSRVRGFYRQFDTARIRSFVAILVERLVRRSIEAPSPSPQAF